jgi:DNA-binding XRE family transcriptional regulator
LGLFHSEAAVKAGVNPGTFLEWEKDAKPPRPVSWPKIITFLGYDPRPTPVNLGEKLVWLRNRIGLGQRAMASALRVAVDDLRLWEYGQATPSEKAMSKIRKLAMAHGLASSLFK